jgi:flagellar protein FlgJ
MTIAAASMLGDGLGARDSGLRGANLPPASSPQSLVPASRGKDTPELKEAFTDFVGQTFFGELLKQMRAAVGKPAYFHGGFGEDVFQSQLDQILVERITDVSAATFSEPMYELLMARRS